MNEKTRQQLRAAIAGYMSNLQNQQTVSNYTVSVEPSSNGSEVFEVRFAPDATLEYIVIRVEACNHIVLLDGLAVVPGSRVRGVGDGSSRGTVISVTPEGIGVLWSREPSRSEPIIPGSYRGQRYMVDFLRKVLRTRRPMGHEEIQDTVNEGLDALRFQGVVGDARCSSTSISCDVTGTVEVEINNMFSVPRRHMAPDFGRLIVDRDYETVCLRATYDP